MRWEQAWLAKPSEGWWGQSGVKEGESDRGEIIIKKEVREGPLDANKGPLSLQDQSGTQVPVIPPTFGPAASSQQFCKKLPSLSGVSPSTL